MSSTLQDDKILSKRPRLQEACVKLHGMAEQLDADAKLPTMVELRSQLGISVQTLNDAVRELEKRNILRSVRGVGIYVAQQRKGLITGNVGFMTSHNMNPAQDIPYWGLILAGLRQATSERDCHLLLIDNARTFDHWEQIDGVVLCNTRDPHGSLVALPRPPRNFPCVSILNEIVGQACFSVDEFGGAFQLTKHLIELGHRRIAYLGTFNTELSQLKERKNGYVRALQEAGIEPDLRFMRELHIRSEWNDLPSWYLQAGQYYMQRWLEEDWAELGCTALLTQNDDAAQGAMTAFQAAGQQVPRDVSVVGFDGLLAPNHAPLLTTVEAPLFEVGEQAMTSLLDWLEDPSKIPQDVRIPGRLVEGQTTAGLQEALIAA